MYLILVCPKTCSSDGQWSTADHRNYSSREKAIDVASRYAHQSTLNEYRIVQVVDTVSAQQPQIRHEAHV
jgi:hypothetical protein